MATIFIHDEPNRIAYRMQWPVVEKIPPSGRPWGWRVTSSIKIVRADNPLRKGAYEHPTSQLRSQDFPLTQYPTQLMLVDYFLRHNRPAGTEISEDEFLAASAKYQAIALAG